MNTFEICHVAFSGHGGILLLIWARSWWQKAKQSSSDALLPSNLLPAPSGGSRGVYKPDER